jgi:phospholipase C
MKWRSIFEIVGSPIPFCIEEAFDEHEKFQSMVGPSTPGNLAIIAAQSGQTQAALHPDESYSGDGNKGPGEPVLNDSDPLWGSPMDATKAGRQPVNPHDFPGYGVQLNQTYATLPLSLAGQDAQAATSEDRDGPGDLGDIQDDIAFLTHNGRKSVPWGWFEEGYDKEPTDSGADPTDAGGLHASYITHHNGPQYFGYIANNPKLRASLHGLKDFYDAVDSGSLPDQGGLFFVKGGYRNIFGMKPADPDLAVQKNFLGDDDHPAYSDAQISEALLAKTVNAIAGSKYWAQCAIIITWDDSEGDYDHVPPPILSYGPDKSVVTDGPRVPLLVISPYARVHYIAHETGDTGSVVKFVDELFNLTPLAKLPDEMKGRELGKQELGQSDWGPNDAITPDVSDLVSAFDPARLEDSAAPLPGSYAAIPDEIVNVLPQTSGYGCKDIGVTPVDLAANLKNPIPSDFNPRPRTTPTSASK